MPTQGEKESTKTTERSTGGYGGASTGRESNVGQSDTTREQGGSSGSSYGRADPAETGGGSRTSREYGTRSGREAGSRQYGGGRYGSEQGYGGGTMSRSRYREQVQDWAQRAEEAIHPLEEYAREKPMTSLLIAAGIGALVGMLFFRR